MTRRSPCAPAIQSKLQSELVSEALDRNVGPNPADRRICSEHRSEFLSGSQTEKTEVLSTRDTHRLQPERQPAAADSYGHVETGCEAPSRSLAASPGNQRNPPIRHRRRENQSRGSIVWFRDCSRPQNGPARSARRGNPPSRATEAISNKHGVTSLGLTLCTLMSV